MGENKTILCGGCHIPIKEMANPEGQMMAVCPTCGVSDTLENAIGEAADYLRDEADRELMAPFEDTSFDEITVTNSTDKVYRFIAAAPVGE